MTEADWLTSIDAPTMLAFVAGEDAPRGAAMPVVWLSERKLRLYLVGCCRRGWHRFAEPAASRVAERFADGLADAAELAAAAQAGRAEQNAWMLRALDAHDPPDRSRALTAVLLALAASTACSPVAELTRMHTYYGRSRTFIPIKA